MVKAQYPIDKFKNIPTPFYYYDLNVLRDTLKEINQLTAGHNFEVHYALKANVNPEILEIIK